MTVVGSYKTNIAFDNVRMKLMMRDTVEESIDQLQECVRRHTPKGKTGKLWESVQKKGPKRISTNIWQGEVYSDLEYAASIEYGWADRLITPKSPFGFKEGASRTDAPPFGFLRWNNGGKDFFAHSAITSYKGAHMFLKGKLEFEKNYAEAIAQRNAREWLGAVDAGRRTVSF